MITPVRKCLCAVAAAMLVGVQTADSVRADDRKPSLTKASITVAAGETVELKITLSGIFWHKLHLDNTLTDEYKLFEKEFNGRRKQDTWKWTNDRGAPAEITLRFERQDVKGGNWDKMPWINTPLPGDKVTGKFETMVKWTDWYGKGPVDTLEFDNCLVGVTIFK